MPGHLLGQITSEKFFENIRDACTQFCMYHTRICCFTFGRVMFDEVYIHVPKDVFFDLISKLFLHSIEQAVQSAFAFRVESVKQIRQGERLR